MTLDEVLLECREFLTQGKGQERHGGVEGGDWEEVTRVNGPGFLTGQAHKKFLEAMKTSDTARHRREMLGVVGYLLLHLINEKKENA